MECYERSRKVMDGGMGDRGKWVGNKCGGKWKREVGIWKVMNEWRWEGK